MGVSVQRLVHRGAARNLVRDRIGLEDALGTTLPDNGRLVIVRKLTVGGKVADPRHRQEAVRRGWVEAVSDAVHATSSFAGGTNCVWFASREEAMAIFLARLVAGKPVVEWFWRLAVPDWSGLSIAEWLPQRIVHTLSEGDHRTLASIAQACVDGGRIELFIEAANRATGCAESRAGPSSLAAASPVRTAHGDVPAGPARELLVLQIARKLLPRVLPPEWCQLIVAIEQADIPDRTTRRLITAILIERVRRASPALALQPQLMREVAEAAFEAVVGRLLLPPANSNAETATHRPAQATGEEQAVRQREKAARRADFSYEPAPFDEEGLRQPTLHHRPRSADPEADLERPPSVRSRHAGLWLVVPSLIRLGFREWLTEQVGLLGERPGQQLIRTIALRHRIPLRDPALAWLDMAHDGEPTPPWTEIWRHTLDRWLRHKARRRIHDLVSRPGTIVESEERIDIHFPLAAADLRLRRLALDSDPGWTDWLGLSIRYRFDGGAQ